MIISEEHSTTIVTKIQKYGYKKIQEIALKYNGVIYGGFVRDKIISDYYTKIYLEKAKVNLNTNEYDNLYWDIENDPETFNRILVPNDIDICFYSHSDIERFIMDLNTINDFDKILIYDMSDVATYSSPIIEKVQRIHVYMKIGKIPFISSGKLISLKIDVVIPVKNNTFQPPFRNLDMLCNGFILTNNGISLSNNTGTSIDSYNYFDKTMISAQIIKDMVEFKTFLCFSPIYYQNINIVAAKRIQKMDKKHWSFLNMPFVSKIFDNTDEPTDCCICREFFKDGDKTANTTSKNKNNEDINSAKMHYTCCMKYIYHQRNMNLDIQPDNLFTFLCPMRNVIDFGCCIHNIGK